MGRFGLTKRCGCPRRAWTNGCPHSWHYKFKWRGRRFRAALDDVLHRHVGGKAQALKEVAKVYEAVRDGTFGRESAETLRSDSLAIDTSRSTSAPRADGRSAGTSATGGT